MLVTKRIVLTSVIFLFGVSLFSLDMTELQDSLSDSFLGFVDENEGLTTFRSLNITSGGREESLGGAFAGLADDISFFDYNPAGSCVLEQGELGFFHNSWIADSNIETFAWTDRFGDLGLGTKIKCFYVPFAQYSYFGDKLTGSYYSETTATLNVSYNFFHGYYFKGLAVGGNFKLAWRSVPDYAPGDSDKVLEGSGLAQSGLGLMIDMGVLLRFNAGKIYNHREPNLRIGLSVMNLGVSLTGFGESVEIDDPLPTVVNLGASYRLFKPFAITADFRKPINLQNFSKSEKWSAGAGIDVNITNFMEVMAGFRLQGANPRISLGSEFKVKKIVFNINYTFDLTTSANPVNRFSLSAKLELGDRGRKEKEKRCDELYTKGLDEYAAGRYESAVSYWQAALEEDKSFTPARKWIETVRSSQQLYNRVLDIQNLD